MVFVWQSHDVLFNDISNSHPTVYGQKYLGTISTQEVLPVTFF